MPAKSKLAVEETPEQLESRSLSDEAKLLSKVAIKRADQDFNEFQQQVWFLQTIPKFKI